MRLDRVCCPHLAGGRGASRSGSFVGCSLHINALSVRLVSTCPVCTILFCTLAVFCSCKKDKRCHLGSNTPKIMQVTLHHSMHFMHFTLQRVNQNKAKSAHLLYGHIL